MSKNSTSFRISTLTASQLATLVSKTGMNQTEVISVAIDRMFNKEIEMNEGIIRDYAETCADIYVRQYIEHTGVMNNPIIVFDMDTKNFGWHSSLTPLTDDEVLVTTLENGCFGDDTGASPDELRAAIATMILDDPMWQDDLNFLLPLFRGSQKERSAYRAELQNNHNYEE